MSKPIIEVKDYSYRYASTEELVLKNITFTVNEGDFVGVVGCNRAGKSTLCKSIVGILPFVSGGDWSGEIVIDGKSLNDTKGNGTTDVVGIVFQDAESQFTQQTVEDEIAFAMCNFGYERNQMRERVKFAAEACGLMGMLDRSLSIPRSKAQQMAENAGAEIAGSVSRRLNLLVVGDEPGSKREKAQALGIRIVDEAGFLALLQADNEVTASSSENAAQDSE